MNLELAVTHEMLGIACGFAPSDCCLVAPGKLADDIEVGSLATALDAGADYLGDTLTRYADATASGFSALNTAFMGDGVLINLPDLDDADSADRLRAEAGEQIGRARRLAAAVREKVDRELRS